MKKMTPSQIHSQTQSIFLQQKILKQYSHFARVPEKSYLKHEKILPFLLLLKNSSTDCSSSNNPTVGKISSSYISLIMAYSQHTTGPVEFVCFLPVVFSDQPSVLQCSINEVNKQKTAKVKRNEHQWIILMYTLRPVASMSIQWPSITHSAVFILGFRIPGDTARS